MRELKFRAWDNRVNQWYETELVFNGFSLFGECTLICPPRIDDLQYLEISQYTGLKDKNGKEIYEGDLVRIVETYIGDSIIPPYIADVYFENGNFNVSGDASYDSLCVNTYNWEVVGNIYDNPVKAKDEI